MEKQRRRLLNITELPEAPASLLAIVKRPRPKAKQDSAPLTELDRPESIERAVEWLHAQPTTSSGSRNDSGYRAACRLKDFGLSERQIVNTLLDHWPCEPMLPYSELEHVARSAYAYGESPPGISDPAAEFETVDDPTDIFDKPKPKEPITAAIVADIDDATIPPRRWLLGTALLRKRVASLISPGGVGKSTLTLQWALSIATGRQDICGLEPKETGTAWIINGEDDEEEMHRRLAAVRNRFEIDWNDVKGKLHLTGGDSRRIKIVRRQSDGRIKRGPDVDAIIEYAQQHKIKLIIVDPIIETHDANENDNGEMAEVLAAYREIAIKTDAAIVVVHHSRKPQGGSSDGFAGDADSARGASSLVNSVRIASTLYSMTAKEAEAYGVSENDRIDFVRFDDAKANFARRATEHWYRKESIELANGDAVGVMVPTPLRAVAATVKEEVVPALAAVVLERSIDGTMGENRDGGRLTLHGAASALLELDLIGLKGLSLDGIKRGLKAEGAGPGLLNGREAFRLEDGRSGSVWYARDEGVKGKGKVSHFVVVSVDKKEEEKATNQTEIKGFD